MSYRDRKDIRSDHKSRQRRRSGEYGHRNEFNDQDDRKRSRYSPPPPLAPSYNEPKFLPHDREWDNAAPAYGAPPSDYMQAPPAPSYSNQVPFPSVGYDQYDTTGIYDNLMTPSQPPGLPDMLVPAPPQVQWNLMPQPLPKPNVEDQIKKEAAIAQEVKHQKATLVKQKEEYLRRVTNMKKELDTLKQQRNEMRSTARRDPSPETKHFLKENTKLQTEIENKLKKMSSVVDMLNGLIGEKKPSKSPERSSKSKKTRSSSSSDSSPERPNKKTSRSRSTSVTAEKRFNYVYYDPEMHWCRLCNDFPATAKDYLNHLHTPLHHKNASLHLEAPWHTMPNLNEGLPNYPAAPTKRTPIKGLQFFVPSTVWYCKLCDQWIGDLHCASAHLKSIIHSKNFTNFVEQNPHWETDWMSDRQKALERQRGGKDNTPALPADPTAPPAPPEVPSIHKKKRKSASPPSTPTNTHKKKKKNKNSRTRRNSSSSSSSQESDSSAMKKKTDDTKWVDKKLLTEDENDRKAIQALKEKMKHRQEKELLASIMAQRENNKNDRDKRDKKEKRERDERKTMDNQNMRGKRDMKDTRDMRDNREARGTRDGRDNRDVRDMRDNRDNGDGRDNRDTRDNRDARDNREARIKKELQEVSKRDRDIKDANKDSQTPAASSNPESAPDKPKKNLVIERKMPFIGKMPVFKSLMKPGAATATAESKPAPAPAPALPVQLSIEDKKKQMEEIQRKVLDFKTKLKVQNQQRFLLSNGGIPPAGHLPPPPVAVIPLAVGALPKIVSTAPLNAASFPQTIYSIAGGISNPVSVTKKGPPPNPNKNTKAATSKTKNPLHQDFQEALDIIFPDGQKKADTDNITDNSNQHNSKKNQVTENKKDFNNKPKTANQDTSHIFGPNSDQQAMFQPQNMTGIMGGPPGHMGGPPGFMGGPPGHMGGPPGHMSGPPGHMGLPPGHMGELSGHMGGPPGFMGGHPGPMGDLGHMGGPPRFMGGPHGHMSGPPGHMGGPLGHMGGPPMHMDVPPGIRMDGPPGMYMDGPPGMHMNYNFNQQGQSMYPPGALYEMSVPMSIEMPSAPMPAPSQPPQGKKAAMDELALLGIDAADVGASRI